MTSLDEFRETLLGYFTAGEGERARKALAAYFDPSPTAGYTGSQFELLADAEQPDEITAKDLVAVSALSVDVPIRPALWLLSNAGRAEVTALLRQVPAGLDIWAPEAARHLARDGAMWKLWDLLGHAYWPRSEEKNGMGRTRKSKLLAAKRPRLSPVLDSIVCGALPETGNLWEAFRNVLADAATREKIEAATASAPHHVSLLRRIDVVIWMAESGQPEATGVESDDR